MAVKKVIIHIASTSILFLLVNGFARTVQSIVSSSQEQPIALGITITARLIVGPERNNAGRGIVLKLLPQIGLASGNPFGITSISTSIFPIMMAQVQANFGGPNAAPQAKGGIRKNGNEDFRPTFSRPRIQPPEPESVEEILAWNALEKARDIEADPCPKTRKRKSATNSPSDADPNKRRRNRKSVTVSPSDPTPVPQLDRPLKRPQTRRIHNLADASSDAVPESSSSRKSTTTTFHGDHASDSIGTGNGPSFLQSLLKEVESSAAPEEGKGKTRHLPNLSYIIPSDHSSPRYSSPGASPTSSNHPTPRALSATPPPSLSARPGSPIPLSSKVEPIYPLPEFSPERSPPSDSPLPHRRRPRSRTQQTNGQYRPRSEEASPTRLNMPLTTKSEIQKMVKDALKSPYQKNEVSKDQYTEINRNVSRMLYDRVGESANLEGESANSWRKIAEEEVSKAVQAINAIAIT
ncbi:hypothetical protein MMC19_005414 [Ptychographa xylographoides]|nr:hypothetical protein [Ptychographa xylographoides]